MESKTQVFSLSPTLFLGREREPCGDFRSLFSTFLAEDQDMVIPNLSATPAP